MNDKTLIGLTDQLLENYQRLEHAAATDDRSAFDRAAIDVNRIAARIDDIKPHSMSGFRAKALAAVTLWVGGRPAIPHDGRTALARSVLLDLADTGAASPARPRRDGGTIRLVALDGQRIDKALPRGLVRARLRGLGRPPEFVRGREGQ